MLDTEYHIVDGNTTYILEKLNSIMKLKKIPYKDRLMHLKLPTLKYRRLRGDMIEVFKITHNIYDPEV